MNKLESFQELLKLNKIQAYIVPISDYHQSEYVSKHFRAVEYLTGFTGSAGTLLVTPQEARLWTDGRYFIQADKELDSKVTLMKSGQPGIPTLLEHITAILKDTDTLGFDGRLMSTKDYLNYKSKTKAKINPSFDLVNEVWTERPELPSSMLYELSKYYSGEDSASKIKRLREEIKLLKADTLILSSLEDQAWLYNLRADDVSHTPVFLSYSVIFEDSIYLFIDSNKLNQNVKNILNDLDVKIKPYEEIYTYLRGLNNHTIIVDDSKTNSLIYLAINKNNQIEFKQNPTVLMKAIKNETEIKNTKLAHEYDGVAVSRLMHYIKTNVNNTELTEVNVSDYLEELRRQNESLIDLSFNTICAYKEHAAMMHYSPSVESNSVIKNEGLLLIDSGGHYLEGTTDITRTFSMGNPTSEEIKYFTTVLKSVIGLASAVFLKGMTGSNLDILARGPIWKELIDYKCGTGHGVGHILSVHEGPNRFFYGYQPNAIMPNMITTDEPGIYLEGKLGIRTENELLCVKVEENEWGTFYGFETITYCPIDLDLVDKSLLSPEEIKWLNTYHEMVYDKLSKHMTSTERVWLKEYTRKI